MPEQFKTEEVAFLTRFVPNFCALLATPLRKGVKREWIEAHVIAAFIEHFQLQDASGEDIESLKKVSIIIIVYVVISLTVVLQKVIRWFYNHAMKLGEGKASTPITALQT